LTAYTNRRDRTIEYVYDDRNQIISKTYDDGTNVQFTYDSRGNLTSATDASGTTTQTYDANDRLTQITYPNGRSVSYSYDSVGRRSQMVTHDGFTVNYTYDVLGRLASLTNGNNETIVAYTYDDVGRLSREDNGNGTYTTYSYDLAGQLLSVVNYAPDDSVNSRFDYTYDNLGRRTTMTTLEGTWQYGYDASGQLISVETPTGRTIEYQYDGAGNRIAVVDDGVTSAYDTNNLNQYTDVDGATYEYDSDGNLISKTEGGETSTYTYDAENRLIAVTTSEGSWEYEYDVFGNRTAVIEDGVRTEYLLDPTGLVNVIGEYDSDGNSIANYVHGLGLETRVDGSNTSAYYDFDAIGSTAGLSGAGGEYVNQYSYLPFGENLVTDETIANPFEYVDTPVHLNTVDVTPPTSSVEPLPTTTTSTEFTVSWTGNDSGSGVASYDIYVAVDDGDFGLWQDDTTETSATFTGEAGQTYAFYSVAQDNVGYIEASPAQADTTTTVSVSETPTLDIDGNGQLESSDYTLINLYASFGSDPGLFDVFLQNNSDVLLGTDATRTTGEAITNYLTSAQDTLFDLDGNGTVETSDYTLLDLYGSFGADSQLLDIFLQQNADVLLGQGATRTTGIEIVDRLDQFLPTIANNDT
jgi:YD repeat-containing protein